MTITTTLIAAGKDAGRTATRGSSDDGDRDENGS